MADITTLLKLMVSTGSSDMHLKVGSPPALRRDGRLLVMRDLPALTPEDTRSLADTITDQRQHELFESRRELDLAYSVNGIGRFRVNLFHQRGSIGMTVRRVATDQTSIEGLGLPPAVRALAEEPRGLVLVTGSVGSGKTTAIAAMLDHINRTREGHIITIEDPIEVLHADERCIVNQREIGVDTASYADALRHVVRQDPDVVLIGEMRDHETVAAALSAAEIGSLVLSTLHTIDATETINRIIDFFPAHQQKQMRLMLAATLKGIISLRLVPRVGGGLTPAAEIMVATATIREHIVDPDATHLIHKAMEEGSYYGMQTFNQSLLSLYATGQVTLEDALLMAGNPHDFSIMVRQLALGNIV